MDKEIDYSNCIDVEKSKAYKFWYQMVSVVSDLVQRQKLVERQAHQIAVRLSKADFTRVEQLVEAGLYRSSADFLREAVRDKLGSMEVISVHNVAPEKAEKMIEQYLENRPGPSFASEIADNLGLDYAVTFKTIHKLLEEGCIRKAKT